MSARTAPTIASGVSTSWQRQGKCRTLAVHGDDGEVAGHPARELAADGEAEADAGVLAGREGAADLDEGLEDRLELVGWDAATCVADGDPHWTARDHVAAEHDTATRARKLDGVRE